MATFRGSSKQEWTSNTSVEHINAGSLQRIADACELMASNYLRLQNDLDLNRRWHREEQSLRRKRDRQIAALRGVITRLKKARK